jgi:hypothetical protein
MRYACVHPRSPCDTRLMGDVLTLVCACYVLACLDQQASLDEDALEVLAIKDAQTRARGTAREAEVAAKRSRVQGAPPTEPAAAVEPPAAPKSATEGVMARWLARCGCACGAAVQG